MSRPGPFGHPYLLGFEEIERVLDRLTKQAEAYPPCNIEELSEGHLRITLAVAGLSEEALSVVLSDRELNVRSERPQASEEDRTFLYKGIAARGFQRSFVLAEGWEVERACLLNGLLCIDLKRVRVPPQVRKIRIDIG